MSFPNDFITQLRRLNHLQKEEQIISLINHNQTELLRSNEICDQRLPLRIPLLLSHWMTIPAEIKMGGH